MTQSGTPQQLCKSCGKDSRECSCYNHAASVLWKMTDESIPTEDIIVDKYQVMRLLGRGSSATVSLVRNLVTGDLYAMKMLNRNVPHFDEARARFQREAAAISKLSHKNLVSLYDFGISSGGQLYFITDFVDGQSLLQLTRLEKRLDVKRAARIFVQMCDAMQYAHEQGLVHRDLKPTNILLARDSAGEEIVRIVDFGIVKLTETEQKEQKLTQDGTVVGSPSYMSPEQCRAHSQDHRTDIYSLGCLLYEVISGTTPFDGRTPIEILLKQVTEQPPVLSKQFPDLNVDPRLEAIIMRMMAKNPDERFQSMADLRMELLPFTI